MLFGKKKKKPARTTPAPKPKPKMQKLWSRTYPQSKSFRGYRKIKLSRYYSDKIDKTINTLKQQSYKMDGREIRLDCIKSNDVYNEFKVINVYVDNMLIGSVFDSNESAFSMLTDYEIDKVHVRIEDSCPNEIIEGVVTAWAYLFVHYPAEAPVKIKIE